MRVFLDDCRPTPPELNITNSVMTAQEAIALLNTGLVTFISLDHDLGDEAIVGSGYQVAKHIEEQAYYGGIPPLKWAVHSANAVGRKNMEAALKSAERYWNKERVL